MSATAMSWDTTPAVNQVLMEEPLDVENRRRREPLDVVFHAVFRAELRVQNVPNESTAAAVAVTRPSSRILGRTAAQAAPGPLLMVQSMDATLLQNSLTIIQMAAGLLGHTNARIPACQVPVRSLSQWTTKIGGEAIHPTLKP